MNKWKILTITAVLLFGLATGAYCGGPWTAEIEGNGTISGGDLLDYGVMETDIDWSFKLNEDTGEIKGRVNIIEKLYDGGVRNLKLFGYEVYEVGDPAKKPILFDCNDYDSLMQCIQHQYHLVLLDLSNLESNQLLFFLQPTLLLSYSLQIKLLFLNEDY